MAIASSATASDAAYVSSAYTWVDKSAASDAQWQLIEGHRSYKAMQAAMKQASDPKRAVGPSASGAASKGRRGAVTSREAEGVLAELMRSGLTKEQSQLVTKVTALLADT